MRENNGVIEIEDTEECLRHFIRHIGIDEEKIGDQEIKNLRESIQELSRAPCNVIPEGAERARFGTTYFPLGRTVVSAIEAAVSLAVLATDAGILIGASAVSAIRALAKSFQKLDHEEIVVYDALARLQRDRRIKNQCQFISIQDIKEYFSNNKIAAPQISEIINQLGKKSIIIEENKKYIINNNF